MLALRDGFILAMSRLSRRRTSNCVEAEVKIEKSSKETSWPVDL